METTVKAILLLSGGIDSPVAGHMLNRQGVTMEALHASLEPLTDDASTQKAKELARQLGLKRLWVARVGEVLSKVPHQRDAHKHYFVIQKRLLYRLADRLADDVGANAIATGENLGQVSSQTLLNLGSLDAAARRPLLRPLLGLDKDDIVRLAREWGSFETSVGPELCDMLGPDKPATRSNPDNVAFLEEQVGIADDDALPEITVLEL